MALNIVTSAQPLHIQNLIVFIYGDPGVWKTSLAFTTKNPILFDFDKGAYRSANRKDTVQINYWSEVANFTAQDLVGYDTIIIDTAGRVLDMISDTLKQDVKNIRRGSNELSMQGYGKLGSIFTNWLKMLRNMGKDIVILAHAGEDKDGDNIIKRPDMVGGSKKEVYKVADLMGYMTVQQGTQGAERKLLFSPNQSYLAKDSGQIGDVVINPVHQDPMQLANIIQRTKDNINSLSDWQIQCQNELGEIRANLMEVETVEQLNAIKDTIESQYTQHPFVQEMRNSVGNIATKIGAIFNPNSQNFEAKNA